MLNLFLPNVSAEKIPLKALTFSSFHGYKRKHCEEVG